MTDPEAGRSAPPAGTAPAALDPVAVIRSRPYLGALLLAAVVGAPISAVAYGFLALVSEIQEWVFEDLPDQDRLDPAALRHLRRREALSPAPVLGLRQIGKRACRRLQLSKPLHEPTPG